MRVFKFRAWDKFNAQYWNSEEYNNLGDFFKKIQHFIDGGNDLIIEQFTGLIDKNGKEVYEGDIIKWKETRFWNKEQEEKGVAMPRFFKSAVVYDDAEFLVSSTQEFDTPLCCFFRTEDVHNQFDYKAEVIGNIYENPELLKR
jgi:uncharacterized phage protein (TIGR01671 family)